MPMNIHIPYHWTEDTGAEDTIVNITPNEIVTNAIEPEVVELLNILTDHYPPNQDETNYN